MKPYIQAIAVAFAVSFVLTPLIRALAVRFDWLDRPESAVKTHKVATPILGGIALWLGFVASLLFARFTTTYPTGTLFSLRAILTGSAVVFILGIIDDLKKPEGLHFKPKFAAQAVAAGLLVYFGIRIHFVTPDYFAIALTMLWVVGITNAFNIIDIMDGLCASQAAVAALGFMLISLPSEHIYVNIASAAIFGSALGFLPWNLSAKSKIFMGDSGSMVLGFVLSAVALGTDYTKVNPLGVFAPLFILLVPMYDTFYVMVIRLLKGQSPFLGSKDHFALRLEAMGFHRGQIVALSALAAGLLSLCAFLVTQLDLRWALWVYAVVVVEIAILSRRLSAIRMS